MIQRTRPWLLGLTVGLILGAVLGAATVSRGTSGRADATVEARLAALDLRTAALEATIEGLRGFIDHVGFVEGPLDGVDGPHLIFEGVNVHLRSGSGSTDDGVDFPPPPGALFGLGNLIIGYNEALGDLATGERNASHNLVIGSGHRYSGAGGLVVGLGNTISGPGSSVTGGSSNTASGSYSSVSGGSSNTAGAFAASVSGGSTNTVNQNFSTISGGSGRTVTSLFCWAAGTLAEQCPP